MLSFFLIDERNGNMKLSACVIVKNEEKCLSTCLESVKNVASEMIVVDTGSTDRTVEIARQCGASVYHFEWIDDFSAARNFALSKATGDWIIFLDADEQLAAESAPQLHQVIKQAQREQYDLIAVMLTNYDLSNNQPISASPQVRLFRNDPDIRYVGAIHERVVSDKAPLNVLFATDRVVVYHSGYSRSTVAEKEKSKRNLALLFKEWNQNPKSSDLAFYISESYLIDHKFEEALQFGQKVLQFKNATLFGLYERNYVNMINCMIALDYPIEKQLKLIQEAIHAYPNFPDFYFFLGDVYRRQNRFHDAVEAFSSGMQRLTDSVTSQSSAYFTSTKVLTVMGQLLYAVNDLPGCVECFVKALRLDKYNYRALLELVRVFSMHENPENISPFLSRIYDYGNVKDVLLLVNVSLEANNGALADYYMNLVRDDQREQLSSHIAKLHLLLGHYSDALVLYRERYKKEGATHDAVHAIAAALAAGSEEALRDLFPSLPQSLQALLLKESASIQKDDLVLLMDIFVRLNKWEELLGYADLIVEQGVLLKTAEICFQQGAFGFAFELYQYYLEQHGEIDVQTLCAILIKMADCAMRQQNWELALQLLQEAESANPREYCVYERQIQLYVKMQERDRLMNVILKAMNYFPESSYLRSLSVNVINH